ncbi:MAG: 2-oxoacid:acceptor oxidoreductase subunit alpha, partial [Deltaproteobacteria bacterium]|nr:2-oxoacid:acceptor oxidoreductase subunit alpha [Deltaproteobacteria bacterium]
GVIKEPVHALNQNGVTARMMHYSELFPFNMRHAPMEVLEKSKIIAVENNFSGQFADFFSAQTGLIIDQRILKYDGRPFTSREIIEQIEGIY